MRIFFGLEFQYFAINENGGDCCITSVIVIINFKSVLCGDDIDPDMYYVLEHCCGYVLCTIEVYGLVCSWFRYMLCWSDDMGYWFKLFPEVLMLITWSKNCVVILFFLQWTMLWSEMYTYTGYDSDDHIAYYWIVMTTHLQISKLFDDCSWST